MVEEHRQHQQSHTGFLDTGSPAYQYDLNIRNERSLVASDVHIDLSLAGLGHALWPRRRFGGGSSD